MSEPTNNDELSIEITSPVKAIKSQVCKYAIVPGSFGYFALLPKHAKMIAEIGTGVLSLDSLDGSERHFFVAGGYIHVGNNQVKVLADVLEEAKDIDISRAKEAQKRALERMTERKLEDEKQAIDWERANTSLKRARSRIDFTVRSGIQ